MPKFKPGTRIRVLPTIPDNWGFKPGAEGTVMIFWTQLPDEPHELNYEVEVDDYGLAYLAEDHMERIV